MNVSVLPRGRGVPRPEFVDGRVVLYPESEWSGLVLGVYPRVSDARRVDNSRMERQDVDLPAQVLRLGHGAVVFEREGRSGGRLSGRKVMQRILELVIAGQLQGVAVLDLSRLTRDERGIDSAYMAEVLRSHGRGLVVTGEGPLDLHDGNAFKLYQTLTMVYGWQRGDTRDKMFDGIKVEFERVMRGEREPFKMSYLKVGYRRSQVLSTEGAAVVGPGGRVRYTIEKDWAAAELMAALGAAFDEGPTLSRVCGIMREAGFDNPQACRGPSGLWTGQYLRRVLADSLYFGEWRPYITETPKSQVWRRFAASGFDPSEVVRQVPELAWFDRSRVERWRLKFMAQRGAFRERKHRHSLLGLVRCVECGEAYTSAASMRNGKTVGLFYKCRNLQSGRCKGPVLSEVKMLEALRVVWPTVLAETTDVVTAVMAKLATGGSGRLEESLAAVQLREQFILTHYVRAGKIPPAWLDAEIRELEATRDRLEGELGAVSSQHELELRAAEVLGILKDRPLDALGAMPMSAQAAVWRALLSEVRFGAWGHARGRRVEVTRVVTLGRVVTNLTTGGSLIQPSSCWPPI